MPEIFLQYSKRGKKRYSEQNDFDDDDIDGCIYFLVDLLVKKLSSL